MNLRDYISNCDASASAIAADLGVAPAYLYQMASGRRSVPARLVMKIKTITGGQVTERDLRPHDWRDIWPHASEEMRQAA